MTTIDFTEPTISTVEIGKFFNLMGIVNAPTICQHYRCGKLMQRIAFLTPGYSQVIIEIWNTDQSSELEIGDWRNHQLVVIQDARFHGISHLDSTEFLQKDKRAFIFRVSTRSLENRFIWISSPSPTFWIYPYMKSKKRGPAETLDLQIKEVMIDIYKGYINGVII